LAIVIQNFFHPMQTAKTQFADLEYLNRRYAGESEKNISSDSKEKKKK